MSDEMLEMLKEEEEKNGGNAPVEALLSDEVDKDNTPELEEPVQKIVKSISGQDIKLESRPWESTNNPWVQDKFQLNRRDGWRPRFVDKNNIERRKVEGWQAAKASDYGITLEEGQIGTSVMRGGMLLMEMPEELALKRDTHIRMKTKLQTNQSEKELKQQLRKVEGQLGDSVGMKDTTTHR